jgi:hypothetical protein
MVISPFWSASGTNGAISPPSMATATLMSMFGCSTSWSFSSEALRFGNSRSASAAALMMRSLKETLAASSGAWALICSRNAAAKPMSTSDVT